MISLFVAPASDEERLWGVATPALMLPLLHLSCSLLREASSNDSAEIGPGLCARSCLHPGRVQQIVGALLLGGERSGDFHRAFLRSGPTTARHVADKGTAGLEQRLQTVDRRPGVQRLRVHLAERPRRALAGATGSRVGVAAWSASANSTGRPTASSRIAGGELRLGVVAMYMRTEYAYSALFFTRSMHYRDSSPCQHSCNHLGHTTRIVLGLSRKRGWELHFSIAWHKCGDVSAPGHGETWMVPTNATTQRAGLAKIGSEPPLSVP